MVCPPGWEQRGALGANIGGCGISDCNTRYDTTSINHCNLSHCDSLKSEELFEAANDVMIPMAAKLSITLLAEVTEITQKELFVRFMMLINPPVCGREAMVVTHKFSALEVTNI